MDDKKLDINYIVDVIQQILNKAHTIDEKKRINVNLNGSKPEISFACPQCGDSASRPNLKRNHLYINNLYSKCYNDESCSCSFTTLAKRFGIEIDPSKKMEIYDHIDNNFKFQPKKDDYSNLMMNKLIPIEDYINFCNSGKSKLYDVKPIEKGSPQYFYLKDRYIINYENIYQGTLKLTEKWNEFVIVIFNRMGDKLIGVNLRNIKKEKDKRIYKIMDFEYIYTQMCPECDIDPIEIHTYNKISSIYNILNINFETPIYIFEGYLDSTFFGSNSVGLTGVNTNIDILKNNDLTLKFVLDNDADGIKESINLLNEGYSVFLWKKFIQEKRIKTKIKDINDLVIHYKNPNIFNDLNLDKYFSIDEFDKLWL